MADLSRLSAGVQRLFARIRTLEAAQVPIPPDDQPAIDALADQIDGFEPEAAPTGAAQADPALVQ